MSKYTTDVLGRQAIGNATLILFTRVACKETDNRLRYDPITLPNLFQLKERPWTSNTNLSTDNISENGTELLALPSSWLLQDVSSQQAESLTAKRSIAAAAAIRGSVLCCCSPAGPANPRVSDEICIGESVKRMRVELLVGVSEPGALQPADPLIKTNAIVCDLGLPYMPPMAALSHGDELRLRACASVHAQLRMDPSYTALPPIVISCPPFSTVHEQILCLLLSAEADLSRVMFNQIALTTETTAYFEQLLRRYPCTVCIDTWGYSTTFNPTSYPDNTSHDRPPPFPSDLEMASRVAQLVAAGLTEQLTLSLAIYCKIQWTQYGGYGLGYLDRVIVPLLRELLTAQSRASDQYQVSCDESTNGVASLTSDETNRIVAALIQGNASRLVHWRPAPIAVEIALQQLRCHICGAMFVLGNHFSKFGFEYCSAACLAKHRKADFK